MDFGSVSDVRLLSGCAWGGLNPGPSGSELLARQQYEELTGKALVACLHQAAKRLDDGQSDASTVAMGVDADCASEWEQNIKAFTAGMSMYEESLFRQKIGPQKLEQATSVVLYERKLRKVMHD